MILISPFNLPKSIQMGGEMMLPDKNLPSVLALLHLGLSLLVHLLIATLSATKASVKRKLSYVGTSIFIVSVHIYINLRRFESTN